MSKTVNMKITVHLVSPLSGAPPFLDSLLFHRLTFKNSNIESIKHTRSSPIKDFKRLPIPLSEFDVAKEKVNACSDPIFKIDYETHDKIAKRFETNKMTLILHEKYRLCFNTGSGVYKSLFKSIHIKNIKKIVWFARGGIDQVRYLLKDVVNLGFHRKIGYGVVGKWEFEEIKESNFIFTKNILMKTIPYDKEFLENKIGYRIGFGSYKPPYWHPENQFKVAIPC